jgi:phosphoadenosine phosphosulfate reductase
MPLKELADRRNLIHRKSDAQTVLAHALSDPLIGETALVSSFGAESIVLLHMISLIDRSAPIIFLDTEMLFEQTLRYQREVADHLNLTDVRVVSPTRESLLLHDVDGVLHQSFLDKCCNLRKTRPLEIALQEFGGWITGRKRYQNGQRTHLPLFEKEGGKIKVNPLASWDTTRVSDYITTHNLPRHPLVAQGFPSIGCRPCTTKAKEHENPRAGRWRGKQKTECGIHFDG